MKVRKLLVTGVGGMVGSYVPEVFKDYDFVLTDQIDGYSHLDVRDPLAVSKVVGEVRPDLVLHLAAATDVDRCEREQDWAYHTNALGTQNVALACQSYDVPLIYISTAGVFWGDNTEPYTEFDVPRPANIYGHSKLAGEHIVTSLLRRYYIVRSGWMVGGSERDKKFVGKIVRMILGGTNRLKVVDDKWGSPTYAKDLLRQICALINTGFYGLYHVANKGCCSRYEVALAIRDFLEQPDVVVEPVSSAHFPLPAPRARSEAMRNFKLELLGLDQMRPWKDALKEYLVTEMVPALSRSAERK